MADPIFTAPEPPYAGGADYGVGSPHPVRADIPASGQPASRPAIQGLGGALLATIGLLLKFKGLALTFVSAGLTILLYAQRSGWAFAVGIVVLILIHESGHLVVARMLGMPVTMPVLIPFLGAFVSMKQSPRTAAQEAQMAIGGPILGSCGAVLCYLGYLQSPDSSTGSLLLGLAWFGFLINLFNLIPVTPLDGGRVLSLLSKWFNVAGLLIAGALLWFGNFGTPVLLLIVLFGAYGTWQRFRSTAVDPAYYAVPATTKWAIGALYLGLLIALALGLQHTSTLLPSVQ
ncbi:MAG TPA: site-2 protease family protein [Candidatus Limnocylindrales bacterium]|nr:site-2 protease family protein [Candidatus Limnocylindrales bacterium]